MAHEAGMEGQKTKVWIDLLGHERKWEQSDDAMAYKY